MLELRLPVSRRARGRMNEHDGKPARSPVVDMELSSRAVDEEVLVWDVSHEPYMDRAMSLGAAMRRHASEPGLDTCIRSRRRSLHEVSPDGGALAEHPLERGPIQ